MMIFQKVGSLLLLLLDGIVTLRSLAEGTLSATEASMLPKVRREQFLLLLLSCQQQAQRAEANRQCMRV
jgi:hypothetical protein